MATRNLIPRGSGEGGLGIEGTPWGNAFFNSGNFQSGITVSGAPLLTVIPQLVVLHYLLDLKFPVEVL